MCGHAVWQMVLGLSPTAGPPWVIRTALRRSHAGTGGDVYCDAASIATKIGAMTLSKCGNLMQAVRAHQHSTRPAGSVVTFIPADPVQVHAQARRSSTATGARPPARPCMTMRSRAQSWPPAATGQCMQCQHRKPCRTASQWLLTLQHCCCTGMQPVTRLPGTDSTNPICMAV